MRSSLARFAKAPARRLTPTLVLNAGGSKFEMLRANMRRLEGTAFAQFAADVGAKAREEHVFDSGAAPPLVASETVPGREIFIDVDPAVFAPLVECVRSGEVAWTRDAALNQRISRFAASCGMEVNQLAVAEGEDAGPSMPDLVVVQLCDHMQHDQGVKKHSITMTYGADGFQLKSLCAEVREDLSKQLASSYWQIHQTHERSAFFVCTKLSNGTADLLITSVTQRVLAHTERIGYTLCQGYVTLSPDVAHTSVRMYMQTFVFRRSGGAATALVSERSDAGLDDPPTFKNFEPPQVGPKPPRDPAVKVPASQAVGAIWDD